MIKVTKPEILTVEREQNDPLMYQLGKNDL